MKTVWNGIKNENPIFSLVLGLCPALAVSTKLENAFVMGICVLLILLFSNFTISLIKKLVPNLVELPVYVLIIGTFVTIAELLLERFLPDLYQILGIYLPLVVVNCIILGRALAVASKERIGKSILDAIGIGLGFMLAIMLIALIREIIGNNTITIMDNLSKLTGYRLIIKFDSNIIFPIKLFIEPTGAFLTTGLLLALVNYFRNKKGVDKNVTA